MHPRAPRGSRLLALPLLLLLAQAALARDPLQLGWLERVRLQPWDIVVKAKLDTGAKTAAIHATDLEYFDKEGKPWVRFKLSLDHRDKTRNPAGGASARTQGEDQTARHR